MRSAAFSSANPSALSSLSFKWRREEVEFSSSAEDASEEEEKVKKDSCKREEMRTKRKNGRKKEG